MSSYETLLENYEAEERFNNITFAEMGSILESLTEFVDEEVNVTVEISLQEAEHESIKDKAGKLKAAAVKGIQGLVAKLQAFIGKITEAVKAFVAKAKKTIVAGGNDAIGKILKKDKNAKLNKSVKVVVYDENNVKVLFDKALKAVNDINEALGGIDIGSTIPDVPESVKEARDAFKQKLDKSKLGKTEESMKGSNIYYIYEKSVKNLLKLVDDNLKPIQTATDKAKSAAKKTIKKLNGAKEKIEGTEIAKISVLANTAMQMNTYAINYATSVLTIATKNSAKLALAAGGVKVDEAKSKIKEKTDKVKGKANEVKDVFKKDKNEEEKK